MDLVFTLLVIAHLQNYFVKSNSECAHKSSKDDIIKKDARFVSDQQHLCRFWKSDLPAICLNPHGYLFCSIISRPIFIFI